MSSDRPYRPAPELQQVLHGEQRARDVMPGANVNDAKRRVGRRDQHLDAGHLGLAAQKADQVVNQRALGATWALDRTRQPGDDQKPEENSNEDAASEGGAGSKGHALTSSRGISFHKSPSRRSSRPEDARLASRWGNQACRSCYTTGEFLSRQPQDEEIP
jgi:hypothetical protein